MELSPASPSALLAAMPSPDKVSAMEAMLLTLPQVDLATTHLIHGGMYARTILIPAGTVLTGALTNCDNICVMFGDIEVTTDHGPQRLTGFHVLPANAGFKRAGCTHADTWWTTIYRTDAQTVEACEREMTDEHESLQTRLQLDAPAAVPTLQGAEQ